ncbi:MULTISPECIES: SHOCT domain-containing protein [Nocardioides]|uniref:SHOCT domain-containing protein n=1 Tax=Nocardioides vastitatis TaxID=2568655 RepID=A0ABW0ZPK6_9ACTN|nr:SHOCT domain-containing protein [Nocardioides sp.]THJ04660.1 SHOCT domain-containing protein [Nocardioides sp.]
MTIASRDVPRPPSLLRSVVPVTLFALVCGVVGPIFLVMGLVAGGDEGNGWLLPSGIVITALDIVLGVLIGTGRYRSQQKLYRLRLRGRPAHGQVLSFDQTGVRINDQPVVALRLRIHGNDLTPFDAERKVVVPEIRLPLLYAGDLPVLVDPESKEWEIDWSSARTVTPAAAPSGDTRSAAERLAELDDLLRQDLVSREEYDAARARILDEV